VRSCVVHRGWSGVSSGLKRDAARSQAPKGLSILMVKVHYRTATHGGELFNGPVSRNKEPVILPVVLYDADNMHARPFPLDRYMLIY